MQGTVTIITPNGDAEAKSYDTPIELSILQNAVHGFIEVVPYFNEYQGQRCVAFVNEEGKLHGLPLNKTGTLLWYQQLATRFPDLTSERIGDHLVGNVVIVTGDEEFMERL